MKPVYIFFFCFLFLQINFSFAQTNVYQPFPNDSARWFYIDQNGSTYPPTTQYDLIEWIGDTVINSTTYKKQYSQHWNPNTNLHYSGGIRQNIPNEKIYEIDLNGVEHDISISQHLMVGDTFSYNLPYSIIHAVDSALIGTEYHKRYYIRYDFDTSNINPMGGQWYIVGVGMVTDFGPEWANDLWCFSVDNILLIGNPLNPACYSTLAVNEQKSDVNKILIGPNPSNGIFIIKSEKEKINNVEAYNVLGEKIYSSQINSDKAEINLGKQSRGIYFYQIIFENKFISTGKIIIE